MSDLVERGKKLITHARDSGMKTDLLEDLVREIERLRLWKKAGQDAVKQRDSLVDEVQRLNAELSAYASENTNLRNDLVQCGMARDNLHKQLEKAKAALSDTGSNPTDRILAAKAALTGESNG